MKTRPSAHAHGLQTSDPPVQNSTKNGLVGGAVSYVTFIVALALAAYIWPAYVLILSWFDSSAWGRCLIAAVLDVALRVAFGNHNKLSKLVSGTCYEAICYITAGEK